MNQEGESPQFSISLPNEAIEIIEKQLIPYGLYGKKRATICRNLILDRLKEIVPVRSRPAT
ncbi:hypothetical protein [Bradyrhizobium prioriisuperbiae]|uniref:hypothetical protein n=1 Tax=Bradyrhizobium prioriisuperbiae TaxID=2854389 RepID=UPI0028F0C16C|nr:hypothetical protein [Bradyrhizobium prioritasuperba]